MQDSDRALDCIKEAQNLLDSQHKADESETGISFYNKAKATIEKVRLTAMNLFKEQEKKQKKAFSGIFEKMNMG